jgi:hypothetical protein
VRPITGAALLQPWRHRLRPTGPKGFSQLTPFIGRLLTTIPSELCLTPQESVEIKDKARWLRRVVNPFADLYLILAVGAAGSPTATETTQTRQDREIQGHVKDL